MFPTHKNDFSLNIYAGGFVFSFSRSPCPTSPTLAQHCARVCMDGYICEPFVSVYVSIFEIIFENRLGVLGVSVW